MNNIYFHLQKVGRHYSFSVQVFIKLYGTIWYRGTILTQKYFAYMDFEAKLKAMEEEIIN